MSKSAPLAPAVTASANTDFSPTTLPVRTLLLLSDAAEQRAISACLQARRLPVIEPDADYPAGAAAGVVIVAAELLCSRAGQSRLTALARQPQWADMPVLVLISDAQADVAYLDQLRALLPTEPDRIMLLQRPVAAAALVSAVEWALRARRRERDSREQLQQLDQRSRQLEETTSRLLASEAVLQQAAETLERRVADRTRRLEAEMAEHRRTEAALRQAHKMEAVGQLTGGIAHDFNNMLTGVLGALDMIARNLDTGRSDRVRRFLEVATSSAQRAAALTHRLLAFSRQQSLDPSSLDITRLVQSVAELLERTLGEQIALTVVTADDLPRVHADANQLESALLNLAINARDAMPDGGQLTIATARVRVAQRRPAGVDTLEPGEYVAITVRDTGFGMTPDVAAKAIDPFFTTKPLGQGTGLGLSMVYGFVRQSNGFLEIESEPRHGTAMTLYLPVAALPAEAPASRTTRATPCGEGETVLVVEDDAAVRELVLAVLNELGYRAWEAEDAEAALQLLRREPRIDLLITDVGLPGVNGRQLAEMARRAQPDLPVLFMTGYAEGAALRPGVLAPGMDLITKPFDLEALAQRIRLMSARNASPLAH
ncbi:MAG: response regulator [Spongiibacteraceae bacterium]|jgi:signal transduction histidine kinase/ActR/RegA family two-component response regulator|nr:response regulator [Spongiibacteraceae bacterium]